MRPIIVYCKDCQVVAPLITVLSKYRSPDTIFATPYPHEIITKVKENPPEIIFLVAHPKESTGTVIKEIRAVPCGASIPLYVFNKALTEAEYHTLFCKLPPY